ncbi:unnamed protein product [Prorocentrum cordatum]|uniref:Uncharacterized protein n=1 Tax=Prorocentrum cordatum TaxID=2364126 RepID=A0ABN9W693_9DINO|nr:unnamed protein product [Polarella glacialis]
MWMWEGKVSVHGFNNRRGNGGERDLRPRPRFRLRPPTLPVEQKKLRRSGARARHGEPLRHFFARKAKRERGGRAEEQTTGSGRGSNQGVKWGTPFKQTARHHSRRGARTAGPFGQCPCAALAIRQRGTIIGQFAVHQQAATSGRTRRGGEANGPNERERREERGGTGGGGGGGGGAAR